MLNPAAMFTGGHRTWGKVVDTDGRPVPEAGIAIMPAIRDARGGVSVSADAYLTAASDAEGVFEFPAVGAGSYQLTVDHAEFTGRAPMSIAIPVGEGDVDVGFFTLTPGNQFEGLVFGPDRRPVAGARVSAFDDHPVPGPVDAGSRVPGPVDAGSRVATTDDDGRFRIGGLPHGNAGPERRLPDRRSRSGRLDRDGPGLRRPEGQANRESLSR